MHELRMVLGLKASEPPQNCWNTLNICSLPQKNYLTLILDFWLGSTVPGDHYLHLSDLKSCYANVRRFFL
jgi:hypothetical protein